MPITDKGIFKFVSIWNFRLIKVKINKNKVIITADKVTLAASLNPVWRTIPLYEPVSKKLIQAAIITTGICEKGACMPKSKLKLKRTMYEIIKELTTKKMSINKTPQRGEDFPMIFFKKFDTCM